MNLTRTPLYAESWNVAFRNTSLGEILKDKNTNFVIIPNSYKYWAADPMIFEYKGNIYIFAELYDYKLRRGTIGYTKFENGSFGNWKQVIVEDFHMSYPNIFEKNGIVYMIPETSESNELIMYKSIDFPDKWEKYKVIESNVKWVDTTFFELPEGLFAYTETQEHPVKDYFLKFDNDFNLLERKETNFNDDLHRCGGRVFTNDENIIWVTQDCSQTYGGALFFRKCNSNMEEISNVHISPEELSYNKKIVLDGIHTYTAIDNIEVIDIKTRRFNLLDFIGRLNGKIKGKVRRTI